VYSIDRNVILKYSQLSNIKFTMRQPECFIIGRVRNIIVSCSRH